MLQLDEHVFADVDARTVEVGAFVVGQLFEVCNATHNFDGHVFKADRLIVDVEQEGGIATDDGRRVQNVDPRGSARADLHR